MNIYLNLNLENEVTFTDQPTGLLSSLEPKEGELMAATGSHPAWRIPTGGMIWIVKHTFGRSGISLYWFKSYTDAYQLAMDLYLEIHNINKVFDDQMVDFPFTFNDNTISIFNNQNK